MLEQGAGIFRFESKLDGPFVLHNDITESTESTEFFFFGKAHTFQRIDLGSNGCVDKRLGQSVFVRRVRNRCVVE